MSAEGIDAGMDVETNQPEQGVTPDVTETGNGNTNPETAQIPEENDDTAWDDVPDPEDDDAKADGAGGANRTDGTDKTDLTDERGRQAETREDGNAEADGGGDPYAFLYDGANRTDGTDEREIRDDGNAETANGDAGGTDAGGGGTALDNLNVDELISGLADGDLKDFTDNYPEEAKMAAKMAVEVLKKLGFDQMRQEVERSAGTAREYARKQMEMAVSAAQRDFEAAVLKVHSDAAEIINGAERVNFIGWLKNQPKFIQRRFRDSTDPEEAADILTRYKASRGAQMKKQQSRTAKIKGISGIAPQRSRPSEDVGWNDVPDDEVPEY